MTVTRNERQRTIARDLEDIKRRFMAALAMAGMTMTQWATAENVTAGHVSQVLSGKRESDSLLERIEQYTKAQGISATGARRS